MNEILEQLEKRYQEARNEEYGIAIEISLARQGIDVTKVAKRDLDQIRRMNYKIEEIKQKANEKHFKIQAETETEIVEVHNELIKINQKIRKEQGLKDEAEAKTDSGANIEGTPKPD